MYAIRNVDARLQEVQATIVKSSYVTMKLAEEMMQAHTEGHVPPWLYNGFSDNCLHTVTFNSFVLQQLDQVRRTAFKPVLPPHLPGLTKLPTGKHAEIFGDDLPARQKELNASLVKPPPPPPKPYSSIQHAYRKRTKPYSRPPTATYSSNCQPTEETRHPPRGQNKVCLTPSLQLLFNPGTVATFNCMCALITQDPFILNLVSDGVQLDFLTFPPQTVVYQSRLSTIQNARITSEVASILSKGVLIPSTWDRCLWLSPVFTRINKDGSSRLILNLKCVNSYITHIHFKMESLTDVPHMLTPCVWNPSLMFSIC